MNRTERHDDHAILLDDRYQVPAVPPGRNGIGWLRGHVARFSEGSDHHRRRRLVEEVLDGIDPSTLARPGDHVAILAAALGLPSGVARDVRTVAAAYQPHVTVTDAADAGVDRLVEACGGVWDERTANLIGILVQACDATEALIAGADPPVPTTRRVAPGGRAVDVSLAAHPFGAGRHACPGEVHVRALAEGARRFHRLHDGSMPLILPNAWDVASALALVAEGFDALGTTSLGIAASTGSPDGDGSTRAETMALARRLAGLPVPVSVDAESGFRDPVGVATELWEMGIAGINIEDSHAGELIDPGEQAQVLRTVRDAAPNLFLNARIDTHWLHQSEADTIERARRYVDAGADGIFVPGLVADADIEAVAKSVPVPLNVLAQGDIARLSDLGVRRISTGSLLYRTALTAAIAAARGVQTGTEPGPTLSYGEITRLHALATR